MSGNSGAVRFLYGSVVGRVLLSLILRSHADRLAVAFLSSPLSRPLARWQAKRLGLPPEQARSFGSYRAFFARTRTAQSVDLTPGRLISPCDGYLSAYPIQADSSFAIKGSHYPRRNRTNRNSQRLWQKTQNLHVFKSDKMAALRAEVDTGSHL